MLDMLDAFKKLSPKDYHSLALCRINNLIAENDKLKRNKESYEKKRVVVESLERLFKILLKHENSECGYCLFCENQWKIIELIQEKLDELD